MQNFLKTDHLVLIKCCNLFIGTLVAYITIGEHEVWLDPIGARLHLFLQIDLELIVDLTFCYQVYPIYWSSLSENYRVFQQ